MLPVRGLSDTLIPIPSSAMTISGTDSQSIDAIIKNNSIIESVPTKRVSADITVEVNVLSRALPA